MHHFSQTHSGQTRIALTILVIVFMSLALSACQQTAATPTRDVTVGDVQVVISTPTKEPYPFKTSEPGTTTVHGLLVVLDPMTLIPAPDDAIYLVPLPDAGITTVPQFEKGTVPQAEVDETTGEFTFTNIQPGSYAVVVITKGSAQIPTRFYTTGNFAIFTVEESQADTTIELDKLSLP